MREKRTEEIWPRPGKRAGRRRPSPDLLQIGTALLTFLALAAPVASQEATGVPGSPSATTSIDGKQLPPPPSKFGGVIGQSARDSEPWWAPRIVPPKGAPNILLIM